MSYYDNYAAYAAESGSEYSTYAALHSQSANAYATPPPDDSNAAYVPLADNTYASGASREYASFANYGFDPNGQVVNWTSYYGSSEDQGSRPPYPIMYDWNTTKHENLVPEQTYSPTQHWDGLNSPKVICNRVYLESDPLISPIRAYGTPTPSPSADTAVTTRSVRDVSSTLQTTLQNDNLDTSDCNTRDQPAPTKQRRSRYDPGGAASEVKEPTTHGSDSVFSDLLIREEVTPSSPQVTSQYNGVDAIGDLELSPHIVPSQHQLSPIPQTQQDLQDWNSMQRDISPVTNFSDAEASSSASTPDDALTKWAVYSPSTGQQLPTPLELCGQPHAKRSFKRGTVVACFFCRKRKIACGGPPEGTLTGTCSQCIRRNQKCEYPTVSYRGRRPKRIVGMEVHSTEVVQSDNGGAETET